jgi:hypothetical protein
MASSPRSLRAFLRDKYANDSGVVSRRHRSAAEYSPPMGSTFGCDVRVAAHAAAIDTLSCDEVRGRPPRYSLGENRLRNRFNFSLSNGGGL